MTPAWIDSHCHLEMLKGSIDKDIRSGFDGKLRFCITIGTDQESNRRIIDFCDTYNNLYGTLGIHPHNASSLDRADLEWLKSTARSYKKIVAIGECGYDYFYRHSTEAEQEDAFRAQLDIARELDLPVVFHTRDADSAVRNILKDYGNDDISGVFHCFTSSLEQARHVLDRGFYLSFNGICTFPQATEVRKVLKYTPADRILLETDSPFLSPVPLRGKPNQPGNVSIVGEYIADFLNMSAEKLAEIVYQNTITLFPRIKI